MKHCPAPDCGYREKHGMAAEFVDRAEVCSDCGAPLANGAAPSASSTAQVPGLAHRAPLSGGTRVALAVTLGAAALAIVGRFLPLPYIDLNNLASSYGSPDDHIGVLNLLPTQLSWAALGLGGWLTSFWVVELAAALVPPWRSLRLRPEGRRRLTQVAVVLGLAFAAITAGMELLWLRSLSGSFGPVMTDYEGGGKMVGAAMIAGSFALLGLTSLVDRYGLLNGFSAVLAGGFLFEAVMTLVQLVFAARDGVEGTDVMLTAAVAGGSVALGWFATGLADTEHAPRPAAGALGAVWGSSLLTLPVTLGWYLDIDPASLPLPGSWAYILSYGAAALLITALLTWALYTPSRINKHLAVFAAGKEAEAFELHTLLLTSGLFTLVLVVLGTVPQHSGVWATPFVFLSLGAIGRDLVDAVQRRRAHPDLVVAWAMHRLHLVGPVLQLLKGEGIAASARGLHHRVLGQLFAPWVPVDIMVPAADVERTRALLDARLPRA